MTAIITVSVNITAYKEMMDETTDITFYTWNNDEQLLHKNGSKHIYKLYSITAVCMYVCTHSGTVNNVVEIGIIISYIAMNVDDYEQV